MGNVLTIAEREFRAFFLFPFVWILTAILVAGAAVVLLMQEIDMMRAALLSPALIFAPVAASALTMRTLAQEYKLGTIELLLTAPSHPWEIVLGKFLAAWVALSALLLPVVWLGWQVRRFHDPGIVMTASSFLIPLFFGAAFVGTGVLASSVTASPRFAFGLSILLSGLWLAAAWSRIPGQQYAAGDLSRGVLDLPAIMILVVVTALLLVLTVRTVSLRRH